MNRKKDIALSLALFLASIFVAAVFWAVLPGEFRENQSTDFTAVYEPVARSIAAGRGVTQDGELATRYPPGFSVLLALIFRAGDVFDVADEFMLFAFQAACAGLAVVLVYCLSRLIWPPALSLIPALAWMTYPFFLWLTKQPNSELPFIPTLYAGLYLFWRAVLRETGGPRAWALYLGAGALAGAAMLIRPVAIGLSLTLAVVVILCTARRSPCTRLGNGSLIILGSVLAVLPWEAAVYDRTGEIIPLSSGGGMTIHDGLTFLAIHKDYRQEVPVPEDVTALMLTIYERRTEMITAGGALAVALEEAGQAPGAFLKLMAIKVARSWYGNDSRIMEAPALAIQMVYLTLILWGSVYAWRQGGALRRMNAGVWLIVLYFWAMTILVVPLLRYMMPVMGLLMIALPGVYLSWAARRPRRTPRLSAASKDY
jgi:4-amino-4-deoxy-L-arabinose transferase-like glycosyltransferase